ncbi:hypothetical protein Tco_1409713 [Tanacetum coccineum]
MGSRINKIFGMSRVTSKGSAPELVKERPILELREIGRSSGIDDEVVQDQRHRGDNDLQDEKQDQPKEEEEIGRSSGIDDEVVQDQRQQDDNDLQDERQDQPKEEEVEPRR